jgi:glycosyltransferase involved in cell wall biosynthesis
MKKTIRKFFEKHEGKISDKWSLYLTEWDRAFALYRDQQICLLEIGIQNGGSLEIWGKYFSKAEKIIGCDIDPKCGQLQFDDTRIKVVVGDANSEDCERNIIKQAPIFDIIIDDGSHKSSDIVRSFARYFPYLNENGIYVVEDLHSSYWEHFEGGLHNPLSSMAFFKRLADIVNYEHWRNNKSRESLLTKFAAEFGITFDDFDLARIHSIEFANSLCIIRTLSPDKNVLGKRIIVGTVEEVSTDWNKLNGTVIQDIAMDIRDDANLDAFELITQNDSLTQMISDGKQEIQYLTDQVSEKEQARQALSAQVAEREQVVQALTAQVTERDQAMQTLSAQVSERDQAVQTYLVQIAEKEHSVQALSAQVTEREQSMQLLTAHVMEKEQSVQALKAQVSEKEQSIQALSAQVAEKDQAVQALTAQMVEKEQSVQALTTQVVEKEQSMQALLAQIAEKDQAVRLFLKQVAKKDKLIHTLSTQLEEKEQSVKAFSAQVTEHEQAIHIMWSEKEQMAQKLLGSDTELVSAKNQLLATYATIQRKEQDLRVAVSFMQELHRSIGWRLILRYRSLLDRLAPAGSMRRRLYNSPFKLYGIIRKRPVQKPLPASQIVESHEGVEQPVSAGTAVSVSHKPSAVCTIASKNYLSMVRVFSKSMARTNPGIPIYVLLVDQVENKFDPAEEPYHLITIGELDNIPDPNLFFFKYDIIELNTAVKPYFLEYLLRKYKFEKVCYFDPDICVFSRLDCLWDLLDVNAMVVTPHITAPYQDDRHPNEIEINLAGMFNLGFIGVSNVPVTAEFLHWWKIRMYDYCYMNPSAGMHVDQNWVNFAPVMQDGVFILRDPAYNIAYWNLHERGNRLRFDNEKLYIDHRPAVFFHFSGLDPVDIEVISKHQDRYGLSNFPNIRPLFEYYRNLLNSENFAKIRQWPYAFDKFDNGVTVPHVARSLYSQLSREEMQRFGNPFSTSRPYSYYSWINQQADGSGVGHRPILTRLQMEIYRVRTDLQKAFPDPLGGDRERYANWIQENAGKDFKLDSAFIPGGYSSVAGNTVHRNFNVLIRSKVRSGIYSFRKALKGPFLRILSQNSNLLNIMRHLDNKYYGKPINVTESPPILPVQNTLPFGVNVAGYIHGEFGVAEAARASIKSLAAVNVPTVLNNVYIHVHRHEDFTYDGFSDTNPYRVNLVHVNADQCHEFAHQKGSEHFKNRYNIGYWFWELSRFPEQWLSSFDFFQEIWVASKFCQESIANISPVPVVKMIFPMMLDESQAVPNRSLFGLPEDKFLFGFIFDYLSLIERKNPFGLIEAFRNAFELRDDAMLVIKTINSEHAPERAAMLKDAARGCNVQFIDSHITRHEMSMLVASFDSFVSLHRSEGFGIGMAQAMYLRKPVIATGYSGNMEFMDHNNSFLVRYKLVELEEDFGPYEKGNVWAEPDLEHAAELMRLVVKNQFLSKQVAHRAETDMKSKMTVELAGKEMKARLLLVA